MKETDKELKLRLVYGSDSDVGSRGEWISRDIHIEEASAIQRQSLVNGGLDNLCAVLGPSPQMNKQLGVLGLHQASGRY